MRAGQGRKQKKIVMIGGVKHACIFKYCKMVTTNHIKAIDTRRYHFIYDH